MGHSFRFRPQRLSFAPLLCLALVAAGCASEALGPSSTAPEAETFVSDRYGFSTTLPAGSQLRRATVDWDASCLCGLGNPAWEAASVDGRTLVVGAISIDPEVDLAQWRATIVELAPGICHDSTASTEATLGGEEALTWTAWCEDGYKTIKLAALHGDRGYVILLASPSRNAVEDNQAAFESLMSTFAFSAS